MESTSRSPPSRTDPMASGHLGEWIAAQIFDIALEQSASATATAISARARCRTVNVTWFVQREGHARRDQRRRARRVPGDDWSARHGTEVSWSDPALAYRQIQALRRFRRLTADQARE